MKKFFGKVLGILVAIMVLGYNSCYADLVVPPNSYERGSVNFVSMIIIGVVIVAIVVTAIMILVKSKKNKEKNNDK